MSARLPRWLQPRLTDIPERFEVARSRLGGSGRFKKLTDAQRTALGRKGFRAGIATATPEQRSEWASRGGKAQIERYGAEQKAEWGRQAAAKRWGKAA